MKITKEDFTVNHHKTISPSEHEVWLDFKNDCMAVCFYEWFEATGKEDFLDWAHTHCHEYEY